MRKVERISDNFNIGKNKYLISINEEPLNSQQENPTVAAPRYGCHRKPFR